MNNICYINVITENYYLLKSQALFNASRAHTINIEQRTTFVFKVRACYNAVLNLRRKFAEHTSGTPEHILIVLGTSPSQGDKSAVGFIWEDGSKDMEYQFDSSGILSCDAYRHLWLGWHVRMALKCHHKKAERR